MKKMKPYFGLKFILLMTVASLSQTSFATNGRDGGGADGLRDSSGKWSLLDLGEQLPYEFFTPFKVMDSIVHFAYPSNEDQLAAGFYGKALSVMEKKCSAKMEIEYLNSEKKPYYAETISFAGIINFIYSGNATFVIPEFPGSLFTEAYPSKSRLSEDALKNMSEWIAPQLVWMKTQTPLENIPDEGVVRFQDNETKEQVAVQKDGYVMVYAPIFKEFNPKNRAGLALHESLLRVLLKLNPEHYAQNGTEKVRELVRLLLDRSAESIGKPAFDQLCGHDGVIVRDLKVNLVKTNEQ